jgi:hypothetical protein
VKPTVYIETTIPSYLAARLARDLLQAANQMLTHDWWNERRSEFTLCTSQLVLTEVSAGHPEAAKRRLEILEGIPLLATVVEVNAVAQRILRTGLLPESSARDASHIAIASVHSVDYVLSWNNRHIVNATIRKGVAAAVAEFGYVLPTLCTPAELMEE